jgi:hypothetical protein
LERLRKQIAADKASGASEEKIHRDRSEKKFTGMEAMEGMMKK